MAKITLDADTFRALASSTRLTVLKALDERRKTLTELSRDLALNKATVHEHMQLLTSAGLVRKRDDEGRKWIYYELTWTGQRILHPEATTTFNLLLGLSVAAAGGGVFMLGRAMGWWFAERAGSADEAPPGAETQSLQNEPQADQGSGATSSGGNDTSRAFAVEEPQPSGDHGGVSFFDDGGWLAIALIATCVLFIVLAYVLHRKMRPKPLDAASAEAAESLPV
ncbi:MAG TPA: winged helix-turn-helix domain-containing protein [Candidatus Thermoplasmatota archaeon]|nr:winged helix-turn-helix domain-containing protein [Candidatus Thermoplasmatota archaeon]